MKWIVVCVAFALTGCASWSEEQSELFFTGLKNEALFQIDRLQALDMAQIEADPAILIAAEAACSVMRIGSPSLVAALNERTAEKNATRAPDDQAPLLTVAQFRAPLDAICEIVAAILVPVSAVPEPEPDPPDPNA